MDFEERWRTKPKTASCSFAVSKNSHSPQAVFLPNHKAITMTCRALLEFGVLVWTCPMLLLLSKEFCEGTRHVPPFETALQGVSIREGLILDSWAANPWINDSRFGATGYQVTMKCTWRWFLKLQCIIGQDCILLKVTVPIPWSFMEDRIRQSLHSHSLPVGQNAPEHACILMTCTRWLLTCVCRLSGRF